MAEHGDSHFRLAAFGDVMIQCTGGACQNTGEAFAEDAAPIPGDDEGSANSITIGKPSQKDHLGRANLQTLASLDAAGKKQVFLQCARRT